jgi:hypothetical protein
MQHIFQFSLIAEKLHPDGLGIIQFQYNVDILEPSMAVFLAYEPNRYTRLTGLSEKYSRRRLISCLESAIRRIYETLACPTTV